MLKKDIVTLILLFLAFLMLFSFPISAHAAPIKVNYAVEVWESFNPSFPGTSVAFYGRLDANDSWHIISSTNMSVVSPGIWRAQLGIANTLYDDFAISISNPSQWTASFSYMRGTPPHQNCNDVNANRQECIGVRSNDVRGETFNWNFNGPPTPTPTSSYPVRPKCYWNGFRKVCLLPPKVF